MPVAYFSPRSQRNVEASRQESIYERLVIDNIDGAISTDISICFNGSLKDIDNFYFDVVIENYMDTDVQKTKSSTYVYLFQISIFN